MKTANKEIFTTSAMMQNIDAQRRACAWDIEEYDKINIKEDWIDREARRIATIKKFIKQVNNK